VPGSIAKRSKGFSLTGRRAPALFFQRGRSEDLFPLTLEAAETGRSAASAEIY
jgi:hypothetical protein